MKKLLISCAALAVVAITPALAADLPAAATYSKAPVYVPAAIYNWTGFYVGGHVGGAWSSQSSTTLAPGSAAFPIGSVSNTNNLSGFLGGVQGGFNWQAAPNFVVGIEGEYSWADVTGNASTVSTALPGFTNAINAKTKDYAMATGRVGYAADSWLFFVKGGGAWGQSSSTGTGTTAAGVVVDTTTASSNRSGWVAGVGIEWGFAPNWSAKIEYNHIDFGSTNVSVLSTLSGVQNISSSDKVDIVKGGVNYHFNWGGPVVAKY